MTIQLHGEHSPEREAPAPAPRRAAHTLAEAGLPPDTIAVQWFGLVAPARTPREVIQRLNAEVEKALKAPEVIERMEKLGLTISHSSPEEMDSLIRREAERWTRVVRERNLKAD